LETGRYRARAHGMDGNNRSAFNWLKLEPPSWWYAGQLPPAAFALTPISALYGALAARRFRNSAPYRSKLPVICVGNFTMGGAGKTPVALKLASLLAARGIRPGFLSRGYGGSERGPHLVDPAKDGSARVGDEPLLLAEAAPTVISRRRPEGARLLETLPIDAIIMDDGFQNPSLVKDFNLIVIDAAAGLGSGRVFPLGPLRAPLAFQAGMADAILLLGGGEAGTDAVERMNLSLKESPPAFAPGRNVFAARIAPQVTEELRGGSHLAFCGIGRPAKFFETLQSAGIAAAEARAFPDHHPYTVADARALLAQANALNASLLTTTKDLARLKGASGALGELRRAARALPIGIEFEGEDEAALLRMILGATRR
jgi:tetraacyldisaccharide 4'-kinase